MCRIFLNRGCKGEETAVFADQNEPKLDSVCPDHSFITLLNQKKALVYFDTFCALIMVMNVE
jgi:hypothetical protein